MVDISRGFERIAKKREKRKAIVESLKLNISKSIYF